MVLNPNPNENKIVRIKTEHSEYIKTLFDVLKEILTEAVITFIGDNDSIEKKEEEEESSNSDDDCKKEVEKKKQKKIQSGIKIVAVDDQQSLMIYVKLDAENFADYYVKFKKYSIGIDLKELYKFMKNVDKDSVMTMSIDSDDQQKLEFHLQNQIKSMEKNHKQKLLDTDDNNHRMPNQTSFEITVLMYTAEFKKICSDLNQFSEYVEIQCSSKEIIFKCVGDQTDTSIKLKGGEGCSVKIMCLKTDGKKVPFVQGIYSLKHLITFGRCINLCTNMQLCLRNSYPMFICYKVGCLGKMLVGLSPTMHQKMLNKKN